MIAISTSNKGSSAFLTNVTHTQRAVETKRFDCRSNITVPLPFNTRLAPHRTIVRRHFESTELRAA
jgi:hypothetical protein